MIYSKLTIVLLTSVFLSACQTLSTKTNTQQNFKDKLSKEVVQKYGYALQLMGAGNDDAAMKMLTDVSKLNDSLSGPYVNRGLIYLKQGEQEKAESSFRDAIGRNSENVTALNQLGILLREKKDFDGARQKYEAALGIDENHPNAHLNLGILCDIYLQDKECAMQHYQAYNKLNTGDEKINNWIIDLKEQI